MQLRADATGPMLHDLQPGAGGSGTQGKGLTVIGDCQNNVPVVLGQIDLDPSGPTVLDRVVDRLLRDAKQVRSRAAFGHQHRPDNVAPASDAKQLARRSGELLQSGHESIRNVLDRLESLKKFAGKSVEYTVCSNTLKAMKVDKQEIVELVDDLYPGIVRIIELQEKGYVYLRP